MDRLISLQAAIDAMRRKIMTNAYVLSVHILMMAVQILVIVFGIMGRITIGELLIASAINLYAIEVRMMYTHEHRRVEEHERMDV